MSKSILDLDSLLDNKYTKEQLKEMLDSFKVGQEVRLTDQCLFWIKENSYLSHTIGSEKEKGIIPKDRAEGSFFVNLYIANHFPYKAEIISFLSDVGVNAPGARLKVTLPNGQSIEMIQSVLDFY